MKNTIPLILAVLLGLAAVFAVSRLVARNSGEEIGKISVIVANKNLSAGQDVREGDFGSVEIPRSAYINHQHVRTENQNLVVGQTLVRDIASGGFILLDDVISGVGRLSDEVVRGDWIVPVHFADATLVAALQEGDEIAIVMVAQDLKASGKTDMEGNAEVARVQTARVLFPLVRVVRRMQDGVLVSLNPKEAQRLLMASLNAPLYPMLRLRGDSSHRSVQESAGVTSSDLTERALVSRDKASSAEK